MPPQDLHETFEWARFIATIVTPFVVFWLGILVYNRRTTMENIDKKMNEIRKEISAGRDECREDIQAMVTQMAEYPRRNELNEAIRDLRQDIREARKPR